MESSSAVPQLAPKLCCSSGFTSNSNDNDANGETNNANLFSSVEDLTVGHDHYGLNEGSEVDECSLCYYNDEEQNEGYYCGEQQWYDNEDYGYEEEYYDEYGYHNYDYYVDEWYEERWYDARGSFDDEGYDCDMEYWYGAKESFDHVRFDGDGYGSADDGGDGSSRGSDSNLDGNVGGGSSDVHSYGYDGDSDDGRRVDSDGASEDADSDGDDDGNWSVEGGEGWKQDAPVTGFKTCYFVYPLSHIGKSHLEIGNKIILPLSALEQLMNIGVDFPMLFKVENYDNGKTSHCGVLEFSAEEGMAVMPEWMMKNLSLENGSMINLESVTLDKATYVKLQPHNMAFSDIRNPKSVLENAFCLGYSCLTVGDTIVVMNQGQKMYLDVVDAKPSNAVCVIDTDVEVDFALPLDYKEPEKPVPKIEEPTKFVPFTGTGRRLHDVGKNNGEENKSKVVFVGGSSRSTLSDESTKLSSDEKTFKPFTGKMYRLID